MRRSRHHTQKTDDHGRITDTVSISERPASVEDRAVPGHWEGDLLFGSKNSQIATLVERSTRYVMLVKVTGKDTETVINALIKHARKLPEELYQVADLGSRQGDGRPQALHTWRPTSRFTSAIRRIPGSAGPMRTPTDSCGSTSPREPTCRATRKQSSMPWQGRLNERPRKTLKLRNTSRTIPPNCCVDRLNPQPNRDGHAKYI